MQLWKGYMKNIASRENTLSFVAVPRAPNHVVPLEISKLRAQAHVSHPVEETQPYHWDGSPWKCIFFSALSFEVREIFMEAWKPSAHEEDFS